MKKYNYFLTTFSLIGLLASFFLMLDTISLIKDPGADLPCNLNPFISCGNAILSDQGEAFGFPNPLIGIASFSALLTIGLALILGANLPKRFWQLINLGLLGSMIFVIWFYYQSLFNLGTLCIYCMIVWAVTWPLFLYTTTKNYCENNLPQNAFLKFLLNNSLQVLMIVYILAAAGIILKFKDFFLS